MPGSKHASFTGSRHGNTPLQLATLTQVLAELYADGYRFLHHGRCRGSDVQAAGVAQRIGFRTIGHPGDNLSWQETSWVDFQVRSAKPNLLRNRDIVDEGLLLIATPNTARVPQRRLGGTWSTVRYARLPEVNKLVVLIKPAGDRELIISGP